MVTFFEISQKASVLLFSFVPTNPVPRRTMVSPLDTSSLFINACKSPWSGRVWVRPPVAKQAGGSTATVRQSASRTAVSLWNNLIKMCFLLLEIEPFQYIRFFRFTQAGNRRRRIRAANFPPRSRVHTPGNRCHNPKSWAKKGRFSTEILKSGPIFISSIWKSQPESSRAPDQWPPGRRAPAPAGAPGRFRCRARPGDGESP